MFSEKSKELLRSASLALLGSAILVWGISYLFPQESYRMPRLLRLIFDAFGPTGLAACFIAGGLAMMGVGFYYWRKDGGNVLVYLLIAAACMPISYFGIKYIESTYQTSSNETPEQTRERRSIEEEQKEQEIANAQRPTIKNKWANGFLDTFEKLVEEMRTNVATGDEQGFAQTLRKYEEMDEDVAKNIQYMSSKEMQSMTTYRIKLVTEFDELKRQFKKH